jgi:Spx/MgsR family transcriptional regulator
MMYIIYGIPNCDTVKKALNWLKEHGIAFEFYDYKKKGITASKLGNWSKQVGWESLLNRKGTTWRQLGASVQSSITSEKKAIALLVQNTSAIKRPLIERDNVVIAVGFDEAVYKKTFKK